MRATGNSSRTGSRKSQGRSSRQISERTRQRHVAEREGASKAHRPHPRPARRCRADGEARRRLPDAKVGGENGAGRSARAGDARQRGRAAEAHAQLRGYVRIVEVESDRCGEVAPQGERAPVSSRRPRVREALRGSGTCTAADPPRRVRHRDAAARGTGAQLVAGGPEGGRCKARCSGHQNRRAADRLPHVARAGSARLAAALLEERLGLHQSANEEGVERHPEDVPSRSARRASPESGSTTCDAAS